MKKLTRSELLALFPKVVAFIEQRLGWDGVDGIVVFERTEEPDKGTRTACVFGEPYSLKCWQDAEGRFIGERPLERKEAVAYYRKAVEGEDA